MRFFKTFRAAAAPVALTGVLFVGGCSAAPQESSPPAQPETAADPTTIGTIVGEVLPPTPGAVVTLTARDGRQLPPPRVKPYMDQEQFTFVPSALIAYAGFPVAFYSSDSEMHNINVRSTEKRAGELNRSIPPGGRFEHVFAEPGFYNVRCDIHVAMNADIFVSPTPFAYWLGSDGKFMFENVPVGAYTLTVHNGAANLEQPLEVVSGTNEVRLAS
jgi:plastocyanin